MTPEIVIVLGILGGAVLLMVTGLLRTDLVAVLVLLALAWARAIEPEEAIAGFANAAVVTVVGVFVLSAGLQRTGVAQSLGLWVQRVGGKGEFRLVAALMATAAALSFVMNTVAIVALFLPVVMDMARRTGVAPARLLMPLAFGGLLGGMTTTFATMPNLLASQALREAGLEPFGVFDFLPVGGAAAVVGIGFMAVVGRRLLAGRRIEEPTPSALLPNLTQHYGLHERMFVLRLPPGCALVGRTLEESRLGSALRLHVAGILRDGQTRLAPDRWTVLQDDDRLLIQGTPDQLQDLSAWRGLVMEETGSEMEGWFPEHIGFAECTVAKGSALAGRTLAWLDARQSWGVNVVALRRGPEIFRSHLQDRRLMPGDVLLVQGPTERLAELRSGAGWERVRETPRDEVAAGYDLESRLFTVRVPEGSPLAGRPLSETRLGEALGMTVLALGRGDAKTAMPGPDEELRAGDALLIEGRSEELRALQGFRDFELEREVSPEWGDFESERLGLIEVVLSPRTGLAGKTLRQIRFRERYGLSVLGIWRAGKALTHRLQDLPLQFGDALLLYGPRSRHPLLGGEADFIVLSQAAQKVPLRTRAPMAVAAVLMFLILSATGWLAVPLAALTAAALMVLGGCLRVDDAYASVDWKAVVLIGGMLPLATALERSGAAAALSAAGIGWVRDADPWLVVAGLFLLTSAGSMFIPGTALVVLMAPLALETAAGAGLSPHAVMMAVALAASAGFSSPVSHPGNVLIMGPGGYRFLDFPKVGLPLTLVVLATVLLVLPVLWPLR